MTSWRSVDATSTQLMCVSALTLVWCILPSCSRQNLAEHGHAVVKTGMPQMSVALWVMAFKAKYRCTHSQSTDGCSAYWRSELKSETPSEYLSSACKAEVHSYMECLWQGVVAQVGGSVSVCIYTESKSFDSFPCRSMLSATSYKQMNCPILDCQVLQGGCEPEWLP